MEGRSYSGGNGNMGDLITGRTRVTKLPSSTTSIDDAVEDMEKVMAAAGNAAICSAYTIKQKRGADFVNVALAEILATIATAVAMAGQSVRVALEERRAADADANADADAGADAGSRRSFAKLNTKMDPSKATWGAHAARTAVAGFRKHTGWFSKKLQRGLVSSPAALWAVWLWWPLAWLWHWIWVGQSAMAYDMPRCSIHELWASAMDAARTATAAADNLCLLVAAKEKSKAKTTTVVKLGRRTPYTDRNGKITSPFKSVKFSLHGIDAHDVQPLRTAAALADAAAFITQTLASSALGASNPLQARRAARASRDATAAALRAQSAYTSILYKIESLNVDNDGDDASVYDVSRLFADPLGKWCSAMDILQSPSADITAIDNHSSEARARFYKNFQRFRATRTMFYTIELAVQHICSHFRWGTMAVVDGPGDNDDNDDGNVNDKEAQDESLSDSSTAGSSEALLT